MKEEREGEKASLPIFTVGSICGELHTLSPASSFSLSEDPFSCLCLSVYLDSHLFFVLPAAQIDDACAIKEVKRLKKRHALEVSTEDKSEGTGESGEGSGKKEDEEKKEKKASAPRVASETQHKRKKVSCCSCSPLITETVDPGSI